MRTFRHDLLVFSGHLIRARYGSDLESLGQPSCMSDRREQALPAHAEPVFVACGSIQESRPSGSRSTIGLPPAMLRLEVAVPTLSSSSRVKT